MVAATIPRHTNDAVPVIALENGADTGFFGVSVANAV
jgi:hypothetical protein